MTHEEFEAFLAQGQFATIASIGLTEDMGRARIPLAEANAAHERYFGPKEKPMKYKVADLSGALLDAAVDRARSVGPTGERDWMHYTTLDWSPSTNWADGGPIIHRERICLDAGDGDWSAYAPMAVKLGIASQDGPTPLIAAMRAYVASKFGEEIELP